jgi:TolA-binding protein
LEEEEKMRKQRGILGLQTIGLIVVVGLAAVLSGYILVQKRAVTRAEQERDTAIFQRNQAGQERDKAISVAQQNAATIAQLQQEKENLNTALTELELSRTQAATSRTAREVIIQQQSTSSSSRATAPPVISGIINSVQEDRLKRRKP